MSSPRHELRRRRELHGLTLAEQADQIGIAKSTLQAAEDGSRVRGKTAMKISAAFGFDTIEELFPDLISAPHTNGNGPS